MHARGLNVFRGSEGVAWVPEAVARRSMAGFMMWSTSVIHYQEPLYHKIVIWPFGVFRVTVRDLQRTLRSCGGRLWHAQLAEDLLDLPGAGPVSDLALQTFLLAFFPHAFLQATIRAHKGDVMAGSVHQCHSFLASATQTRTYLGVVWGRSRSSRRRGTPYGRT